MLKPKYPATLEKLVAMQLRNKSRGFRRKFYKWYIHSCLHGRNGNKPTEEEVDVEIIRERSIKYEQDRTWRIIEIIKDCVEKFEFENQIKKTPETIPDFPMKFKEFLRRAFGGRLHSDRLRLFRKFLVNHLFASYVNPEEMAVDHIAGWIKNKMQPTAYFHIIQEIKEWRPRNKIQQRRNANESRRLKENRKKILYLLKNRLTDISHR
jgi:hypothetical protein